jgi:4-amino-4-deoxy-L-arabinose transferase-like glycosyltransferase
MSYGGLKRRLILAPLLVIVLVWIFLYLPHLRTSPRWYGDETLTLMIGKSLAAGQAADRSLKATFWHPSYPYQPGFAWLAGGMAWISGGDIFGARLLNTSIALAIALLIYFGGRAILGCLPSLFGALLFLSYDQSVIHFRWVYPHNGVALGFTIAILALLRSSRPRVDWRAGLGLAIGALSHPLFIHGAVAAWACRIKRPKAWIRLILPATIVLASTIGLSLVRYWPHLWVFQDMGTLVEFYRDFSRENAGNWQAPRNIAIFYSHDLFHLGSVVAIILCCSRRLYPIAIFAGTVSLLLLQNRQNLPVFYYQAIVLLPIFALAWAGGLQTVSLWLRRIIRKTFAKRVLPHLATLVPIAMALLILPLSLRGNLVSRNDFWVTQDVNEVERAAAWINEHVRPAELVICGQNIGWLLNCRTADLLQTTAWEKRTTFGFPRILEAARFRYDADISKAKYLVLGDIDSRWTIHQSNVWPTLKRIGQENWPIVWSGKYYLVAENPTYRERQDLEDD